jgi:hypothetical protein
MKLDSGMQIGFNIQPRFVKHDHIDFRKYDQCVESASGSLVYAWSWYLDIMAGDWDAFVWGNYEYVMPVPSRRKWGIRYVYQPVFAQQLGIYPTPPADIQKAFFKRLKRKFRYIHYQVPVTIKEDVLKGFMIKPMHTRLLSLEPGYPALVKQYDDYILQNLKKARQHDIKITRLGEVDDFFELKDESKRIPVPEKSWRNLRKLMKISIRDGSGWLYSASGKENEILAAAFFLVWRTRAYYMTVVSNEEGRDKRAGFALLDQFLRDFAGQPLVFDFEGSSVPGVDKFFESFGAEKEFYSMLSRNRLPWFISLFKK